jgi:hypothetical protein
VEVSQHDAWALREREQVRPTVPPAVRARELAEAARAQREWAEEPRVVFYLYHPPDEKLRAHLEAEGVLVEVAPAPVPLLPETEGSAPPER